MRLKYLLLGSTCIATLLITSGCAVVAVTGAAASVAGTAVSVGLTAGSVAVGAATTVAKGAVSAGSAVLGDDDGDEE
jgi:hypothetical protein